VDEDEGIMGEGLGVLQAGVAPGSVADVSNEEVRADLTSLGGELPVPMSSDGVLLHYWLAAYIMSETRPVRVSVGLVEHGV
jgi:hypothetical protein